MLANISCRSCLLLLALSICWSDAIAQDSDTSDKTVKAIRQVLDDQVQAWNKGDLPAFMKGYWESPKLTFFSGKNEIKGWQATLDRYRKKYQDGGQPLGTLSFGELDIKLLGAGHALVRGRWQLVLPKETVGGLFTLIFEELPAGWRIVHDHTSS